ncbi:hypothetical protein [Kribbella solani]|uniref:hypothetical protein n=1 Tax=Kribbella solani TaxID=236067 RepID=UPI0029A33F1E|nr:hypothetical protein [Kribbella solani]MDX2970035.1 hypothetical protein [Kribbella solani]
MTDYAYDTSRHALVTSWNIGVGRLANTLAALPTDVPAEGALRLASALSGLSRHLWRCYTDPASSADSMEPNTEGWRRQGNRDAFSGVLDALRNPNLPHDGHLEQSYIRVEEAAHRVGRALHSIASADLIEQVAGDVAEEIDAVERAELGDLTDRAKQAVALTRSDASPLQVLAANDIFQEQPLGSSRLFEEVDATAAAIAAAHWLQAAAQVAAEQADCDPTLVVAEADNIEALAVRTPTTVLEMLEAGESPRAIVVGLVRDAMTVAEGKIPDPESLIDEIEQARTKAEKYGPGDQELLAGLMPRLTPLDPTRPAQDLLEDLLDGIRGCRLLYSECADYTDADPEGDEEQAVDNEFLDALRDEAATYQDRIL